MAATRETMLYHPVKAFLVAQGFKVRGEVKGCDLAAVRGDDLVVVELKRAFNLELVLQGIERLRLTDLVYLAVPSPRRVSPARWRRIERLCRRLGLGLLTVRLTVKPPRVEVVCDPGPYAPRPDRRGRGVLLGELQRRSTDGNVGGSTGVPIMTAYREDALRIADVLRRYGPARVKQLREATGCIKTCSILGKNFYGWFERIERGVYQLTPQGVEALTRFDFAPTDRPEE